MPRVLLVLTIAAWMAIAGSAAAAPPPPPPPGHIAFAAGPNSPVTVGTRPKAIAVGDLDGDGNLDFVTANTGSDTYRPVYGNGVGGFTPGIPEDTGDGPESIVLADFDGDTRLDIAVANRNADTVWVMLQETPGEFNQLEPIPSGGDAPVEIAAGRLDANASVDLVVAEQRAGHRLALQDLRAPQRRRDGVQPGPRLAAGGGLHSRRAAGRLRRGREARPL